MKCIGSVFKVMDWGRGGSNREIWDGAVCGRLAVRGVPADY